MAELPVGTVTFLFTDLEASTRLWEQHPDAMKSTLARHDAILRGAVASCDGWIVKTTGDGIHAAFTTAHGAVAAALAAQRGLNAQDWSPEPLRVRMGIHTGEAELRDGDYYGGVLNRAARLMGVAHGGQVLLSQATADLLADSLEDGVSVRDLGEHRLRDLTRPERVFQLVGSGLPTDFPALRSVEMHLGHLPESLTSFVGRERDLEAVVDTLREARIITLTGVGGVGKTRLACQVAAHVDADYPGGAWLCELAAATDEASLQQVVAATLGAQPQPGLTPLAAISQFIHSKHLLLLLDNCEHLLNETGRLADHVLRACPHVRILATSREGLGLLGERLIAVRSLAVPDAADAVAQVAAAPASRLFTERARAVRSDFVLDEGNADAVGEICRRLDGIPLAIELAAARVIAMRPAEIAALLDEQFRLLVGGHRTGVERHQTLRATVEWSYSLLEQNEQTVFDRLGVFSGEFDAAAATAVIATDELEGWDVRDALSGLVAKSMLVDQEAPGGTTRYRLLETLRQYALERLQESSDVDRWRRRHAEYYAGWAEAGRAGLLGPDELDWLARFEAEFDNLRAAVTWSLARADPKDVEAAIRVVAMLPHTALSLRDFGEWADRLADRVESTTPGRRTDVLAQAALWNALLTADAERARALAMKAMREEAPRDANGPGNAYSALAIASIMEGRPEEAMRWVADGHRAIAGIDNPFAELGLSTTGAVFAGSTGDYELARTEADRALTLARRLRQATGIGMALFATGVAREADDPALSLAAFEEAISIWRARADRGEVGMALAGVTRLRIASGDVKSALAAAHDGIAHYYHFGLVPQVVGLINEAIVALAATGQAEVAVVLAGVVASGHITSLAMTFNPERMEAVLAQLRDELDTERYEAARARGESMTADEAVAFVLGELDRLGDELPEP